MAGGYTFGVSEKEWAKYTPNQKMNVFTGDQIRAVENLMRDMNPERDKEAYHHLRGTITGMRAIQQFMLKECGTHTLGG